MFLHDGYRSSSSGTTRWLLSLSVSLLATLAGGCGKVSDPGSTIDDASMRDPPGGDAHAGDAPAGDAPSRDAPTDGAPGVPTDGAPGVLGSKDNPARTCAELHVASTPSGTAWLRGATSNDPPFQVYCEQQLQGGGWAMLENSVRRQDGTTAAFWQFKYADRLKKLGTLAPDQNYYHGALYLLGTEYMDVIVDLQGHTAVAAVMTATGFDAITMQFTAPKLTMGNQEVFTGQFASGWAAADYDGDAAPGANCATLYGNIAQHYANCWAYSLGSDANPPGADGGVGPHVIDRVLTALSLTVQDNSAGYSQVKRIARFTRW